MTKIGIIGAGAIARRAHLPAWQRISRAEVVALADMDRELAERVATEFQIGHWVVDYTELLEDPTIEVIDICTPTPTHSQIVMEALSAGKDLLVEKPLAFSLEETLDIYDRVLALGRKLTVVQNYRYIDCVTAAKDALEAGRLGQIESIHGKALNKVPSGWTRGRWLYHRYAVLYDFTPHLVDLMSYLVCDAVKQVFAVGKDFTEHAQFVSSAQALVEFRSGVTALLDTSWTANAPQFQLDIFGNGGSFSVQPMRDHYWEGHGSTTPLDEVRNFAKKMGGVLQGIVAGDLSTKQLKAYTPLFEDFLSSVVSDTKAPIGIEEGLRVDLMLEAMKSSIATGRPIHVEEMLQLHNASQQVLRQIL